MVQTRIMILTQLTWVQHDLNVLMQYLGCDLGAKLRSEEKFRDQKPWAMDWIWRKAMVVHDHR